MVGFDPTDKVHLTASDHALAGASSAAISRAFVQPMDVLKIRFQLQVEPLKKAARPTYYGVIQACHRIIEEEGLRALWKGHVPAQTLSVAYGIAQYASFEFLTQEVWHYLPETLTTKYRPMTHSVCGGISGCIGAALIHPIDVIRTRVVAQGEPKLYKNMFHAMKCIMVKDGISGYYRGLVPALSLVGPQMASQFGLYAFFCEAWKNSVKIVAPGVPESVEHFICGSAAGAFAKIVVYPLDVIKKRLQIQGFEEARQKFGAVRIYNGVFHCFFQSLKDEGFSFFYKGLSPSLIKAASYAGITLCVYEYLCSSIALYRISMSDR